MKPLSVREYRNNPDSASDRAHQDEQRELDEIAASLRRSIQEVKDSLDGKKELKKARDIIKERL